ncbi:MAG: cytochrome c [Gemmatimonadota bacterium]|jgi:mono/diheme cytochrome c family protein
MVGPRTGTRVLRPLLAVALVAVLPRHAAAQDAAGPAVAADADGRTIYRAACANCHGPDGAGRAAALVAFEEELPDFTSCTFASREPDADWVGVAHEGGPGRGFSRMMPAFGGLLTPEQLQRAMDYVRTLCGDDDWPRGELNFPRALLTEKAYPEDEAVLETDFSLEETTGVSNAIVYERRFGKRSQLEVVVPFAFQEKADPSSSDWVGGLGDLVLGVKRDMFHDFASGTILSLGGEVKLPTGDESDGFGGGVTVFESFVSYGQALPADAFFQLQAVVEVPADSDAENEGVFRGGLGRTFTQGRWGRAWTPMVEVQAKRELEGGATTTWDLVPQLQVTLNTRQHIMANVGVLVPMNETGGRDVRLVAYLLWDWFDGGFFEGW